jgi:cation:H+ antiporter
VLVGAGLIGGRTSRPAGVVLLVAFAAAILYLLRASRDHTFLESEEVKEAQEELRSYTAAIWLTIVGLVVIALGGELVTRGAQGMVSVLGLSSLLVGMVMTPASIQIEEVIRQAVPAREGRPEVSAGNLVGTLLYFLWFNMGLISLLLPVRADSLVVRLEWPYLVGVTWLATLFFARGRVGRPEGALLVALYVVYVTLHVSFG